MRQKIHPNPLWKEPYGKADLYDHLVQSREYYKWKRWSHSPDIRLTDKTDHRTIEWLYETGVLHRVFKQNQMPYSIFSYLVQDPYAWLTPYKPGCREKAFRWWRMPVLSFRQRYHHVTTPKEWTAKQISRKDWREKKKFHKDKAKGRGWRRQGQKTWAKRVSNKKERQHVRNCLHHGKEILPHRRFVDKWMWD